MLPNLFANYVILVGGTLLGIIVGFFIQKSRISQFSVMIEQFLLKDFTVLKVILSAVITGSILTYGIMAIGLPFDISIKGGSILLFIIGGILFGIGVAILGYTPATSIAAAGQGSKDALWGMLGMLVGAFIYSQIHKLFDIEILEIKKVTIPQIIGISPWIIIGIIIIVTPITFWIIRKKKMQSVTK